MPTGTRLSRYEAGQIDALLREKRSVTYIAASIKRSRKAVQTYMRKGTTYFDKHPNGMRRALSESVKRRLIRHVSATGDSVKRAKRALSIAASNSTVLRALRNSDTLKYVKARAKPKLTERHMAARLEFARVRMTWSLEWRMVIFRREKVQSRWS